jgi:hypothetical protein
MPLKNALPVMLLIFSSGCMGSCSCGLGGGNSASDPAQNTGAGAIPAPKQQPSQYTATPLTPLADAAETRELRAQQAKLQAELAQPSTEAVASSEVLRSALPEDLGGFHAAAGAIDAPSAAADAPAIGASSRRYAQGVRELYVKIEDTVRAPQERASFIEELTQQGNASWGTQRGRLLAGMPAIERKYTQGSLGSTLLVQGRYLVEVRLRPTGSESDLQSVVNALPLGVLSAAHDGAAGGGG